MIPRARIDLVGWMLALASVLTAGSAACAPAQPAWRSAVSDYGWSFPRDHWGHGPYRTEWWYFTGHLTSEETPPRRFGYQFTLFRVGLLPERPELASSWAASHLIMGHLALTDLQEGRHVFSELLYREIPLLGSFGSYPDSRIAWCRGPVGTDSLWSLRFNGEAFDFTGMDRAQGFGLDLRTRPVKPLALQGKNGFSRKGREQGAASQYYSFTRLETRGTLDWQGRSIPVTGLSWMDKEFGSGQLSPDQVGWDWFSLQLSDGTDLMLYLLRERSGEIDAAYGTWIGRDGRTRYLEREDFAVRVLDSWRSPETKAEYPSRWEIELRASAGSENAVVPGRFEVLPLLADQENRGKLAGGLFYWEGAVEVRDAAGGKMGQGYVELTGYGTNNRPAL